MDHPLLRAFIESGPVGQGILIILLALSVVAWSIIIEKIIFFRKLNQDASEFLNYFRDTAKSRIGSSQMESFSNNSLLYTLYKIGVRELSQILGYKELASSASHLKPVLKNQQEEIEQSLKRQISRHAQILDRNMIILATSANISPFLGLLGTVYGLLIAFYEMGRMGSASIDVVSPGISQALITTVVGLFVAIPSAVGYNYLLNAVRNLVIDMENFMSEFISLVEKGNIG
ncbi:MAG: MotA/TolQ/ExbB proton channel family protein [Candidatus Auribacterota bacterium]|jgi:biopolymer transport protein TolQ|nr:MotA/TolQ/ExbB proton channel family protein [Candidatus Auribacterota bacterium]